MLEGASTDLFDTLVLKAHNSECLILLCPLHTKPVKDNFADFCFCTLGTSGLNA